MWSSIQVLLYQVSKNRSQIRLKILTYETHAKVDKKKTSELCTGS